MGQALYWALGPSVEGAILPSGGWGTLASMCLALLCEVLPPPLCHELHEDTDRVLLQGSSLDISAHGRWHILGDRGLSLEVDAEDFKVSPFQAIR